MFQEPIFRFGGAEIHRVSDQVGDRLVKKEGFPGDGQIRRDVGFDHQPLLSDPGGLAFDEARRTNHSVSPWLCAINSGPPPDLPFGLLPRRLRDIF